MTDRNGTNLRVGPRETAIITGMHGGNVSWSDVPGTCSTGYCTWPPYKSLGFCSSVDDVTSSIRKNCTSDHCTYSVLPLNSTSPQAPPGLTYPKFYRANSSLNDQTANFWVGSVYENFGLLDIYIIWEHVPFPSGQYSATRGRIEPCVHNLTSRMDNGTVTTALISSENDWKPFKVPPPANSPYFGPYCVKIEDPTSSYSLFNESGIGICYSDEQDGLHPFLRYLATDIFDGTAQSLGHNQPENNFFDNNWVFYTFMSIYGRHILYDMGPTPGFDGFSELLQNLTESISNA
jgi:hypothetical protein